jgi:hypothetical protein
MNMSLGLVLVIGITIIFGVFVIADTISPVTGGGKGVNDTAYTVQNSSMQAELLVRFNPELWNTTALQSAARASHDNIGATVITDYTELGLPGLQLITLPPGMTTAEGKAYYEALPYVQYAEPNAVYSIESSKNQTSGQENLTDPILVSNNGTTTPSRLLVQFNVSVFPDKEDLSAYANQIQAKLSATLIKDFTPEGLTGLYLVELPVNMTEKEGIGAYKNQTSVVFAEPNSQIRISEPVKKG